MTETMTLDEWVEFYQKNPHLLKAFIKGANEEIEKLINRTDELERQVKALQDAVPSAARPALER